VGPFASDGTHAEMTGWCAQASAGNAPWSKQQWDFEAFYAAAPGSQPVHREILVRCPRLPGLPEVKPGGADKTVGQEGRKAQQEEDGDRRGRVHRATDPHAREVIDSLFRTGKRPSRGAPPDADP